MCTGFRTASTMAQPPGPLTPPSPSMGAGRMPRGSSARVAGPSSCEACQYVIDLDAGVAGQFLQLVRRRRGGYCCCLRKELFEPDDRLVENPALSSDGW